jgi:hypothetical protein
MQRFKSPEQANDFLSAHAFIYGSFPSTTTPTGGLGISCAPDQGIQCLAAGHSASETQRNVRNKIVANFRLPGES